MEEQKLILVNERDEPIGEMGKMEVHQKGVLHRAFSVFIFDNRGRMLLQQRAGKKYHGAFLWTNACCSHPFPGEDVEVAAQRRLKEELGFTTPLSRIFTFTYKAQVENGLTEHEFDHVFAGEYQGVIHANKTEVEDHRYEEMDWIREAIKVQPQQFTSWFRIAFPEIDKWWQEQYALKKKRI